MSRGFALAVLSFFLVACDVNQAPAPPADRLLADNIAALYLQSAPGIGVKDQRVVGKHYSPGNDLWRVVFCVNLDLGSEGSSSDCNDSFQLLLLDSGRWIVGGNANGQYRWQEVVTSPLDL